MQLSEDSCVKKFILISRNTYRFTRRPQTVSSLLVPLHHHGTHPPFITKLLEMQSETSWKLQFAPVELK